MYYFVSLVVCVVVQYGPCLVSEGVTKEPYLRIYRKEERERMEEKEGGGRGVWEEMGEKEGEGRGERE